MQIAGFLEPEAAQINYLNCNHVQSKLYFVLVVLYEFSLFFPRLSFGPFVNP